jgi:hypothetical protein
MTRNKPPAERAPATDPATAKMVILAKTSTGARVSVDLTLSGRPEEIGRTLAHSIVNALTRLAKEVMPPEQEQAR